MRISVTILFLHYAFLLSGQVQTTNLSHDYFPSFSPYENKIAFICTGFGYHEIWFYDMKTITFNMATDSYTSWSSNGKNKDSSPERNGSNDIIITDQCAEDESILRFDNGVLIYNNPYIDAAKLNNNQDIKQ